MKEEEKINKNESVNFENINKENNGDSVVKIVGAEEKEKGNEKGDISKNEEIKNNEWLEYWWIYNYFLYNKFYVII